MKPTLFATMLLLLSACGSHQQQSAAPDFDRAYQEYLALGARYVEMGRYDLAEPKLKRAIEINAQDPQAWNVLAVMFEEKRDIAAGYQAYGKLINSHPNYQLGFVNFATFLCKFERDKERHDLYQKMRSKNEDFQALSYIVEGDCARNRRDLALAERAYKKALAIDPHAIGALLPLADTVYQLGDAAAALRYLKVVHTYVGYSVDSVAIALQAARKTGDQALVDEMTRILRANYHQTPQAQALLK